MAMMPDSRGPLPTIKKGKIIDMVNMDVEDGQAVHLVRAFPAEDAEGVEKLHKQIDLMAKQDPLFGFHGGAGGTTSDLTSIVEGVVPRHGVMVNMHLTCTNQTKELWTTASTRPRRTASATSSPSA